MRITVTHGKTKSEALKVVNEAADRALSAALPGPLRLSNIQKSWSGDQLNFSLTAALMSMSAPIKGYILVTERDITIEADLPALLTALFPEQQLEAAAEQRIKGLLK